MTRLLGMILAVALAAVLVPQGSAPVEAAGKKAAKKGTASGIAKSGKNPAGKNQQKAGKFLTSPLWGVGSTRW